MKTDSVAGVIGSGILIVVVATMGSGCAQRVASESVLPSSAPVTQASPRLPALPADGKRGAEADGKEYPVFPPLGTLDPPPSSPTPPETLTPRQRLEAESRLRAAEHPDPVREARILEEMAIAIGYDDTADGYEVNRSPVRKPDGLRRYGTHIAASVPLLAKFAAGEATRLPNQAPDRQMRRAAVILSLIGEPARAIGVPAILKGLTRPEFADIFQTATRTRMAASVMNLCGGPDATGACIAAYLREPDAEVRSAAVRALGRLPDFESHRRDRVAGARYTLPPQDRFVRAGFYAAIPRIAESLNDNDAAVREGALAALRTLTNNSWDAPWETAVLALQTTAQSSDATRRQAAAEVLSLIPGRLTSALPMIRELLLADNAVTCSFALIALDHRERADRGGAQAALLQDFSSTDRATRHRAARQIEVAAGLLWGDALWGQKLQLPRPDWSNPTSRNIENRRSSWHLPEEHQWGGAGPFDAQTGERQHRLLSALGAAISGGADRETTLSAARALRAIGTATLHTTGGCAHPHVSPGTKVNLVDKETVAVTLEAAAAAIRSEDATLSDDLLKAVKTLRGPIECA